MSLGDDHGYGGEQGSRVDDFGGTGQTRTRLPGGADTDIYGGARRPVRNSRSLITVVGIVVLLIAAIAFANQSGDEGSPDETAKGAESAPTAATGVKPVKGKAGAIPTGYARDEQGAQSAAANYAVALGSDGMFRSATRREIVETVADAGAPDKLQAGFEPAYSPDFPRPDRPRARRQRARRARRSSPAPFPSGAKVKSLHRTTRPTSTSGASGMFGLTGEKSTRPVTKRLVHAERQAEVERIRLEGRRDRPEGRARRRSPGTTAVLRPTRSPTPSKEFGGFTYAR